jgi:membrane dipeptidase
VPFFLAAGAGVTVEAMLDHIDYVAARVGWRHVAIGTDWPMAGTKWSLGFFDEWVQSLGFRAEHGVDARTNLIGFDDYRDFPNLTRGLVERDYTDEQIAGILGENFLRVFEAVCG